MLGGQLLCPFDKILASRSLTLMSFGSISPAPSNAAQRDPNGLLRPDEHGATLLLDAPGPVASLEEAALAAKLLNMVCGLPPTQPA